MSVDESLFRAINSLTGQSDPLDWLALTLSNSSLLWAPGILLTGYWLWLSWREVLLAAPLLARQSLVDIEPRTAALTEECDCHTAVSLKRRVNRLRLPPRR